VVVVALMMVPALMVVLVLWRLPLSFEKLHLLLLVLELLLVLGQLYQALVLEQQPLKQVRLLRVLVLLQDKENLVLMLL
jgi:hypothetical protein